MSVFESLIVSLFCIALVFFVLSCLFILIKVLSAVLKRIANKRARTAVVKGTAGASAAEAGGETEENGASAGELKLLNVDEKTAAMIMAIVSHESGIPLSELVFKSIKAVEES